MSFNGRFNNAPAHIDLYVREVGTDVTSVIVYLGVNPDYLKVYETVVELDTYFRVPLGKSNHCYYFSTMEDAKMAKELYRGNTLFLFP